MFSSLPLDFLAGQVIDIIDHQLSAWCMQKRPLWVRKAPDQHHLNTTRGHVVHLPGFVLKRKFVFVFDGCHQFIWIQ